MRGSTGESLGGIPAMDERGEQRRNSKYFAIRDDQKRPVDCGFAWGGFRSLVLRPSGCRTGANAVDAAACLLTPNMLLLTRSPTCGRSLVCVKPFCPWQPNTNTRPLLVPIERDISLAAVGHERDHIPTSNDGGSLRADRLDYGPDQARQNAR